MKVRFTCNYCGEDWALSPSELAGYTPKCFKCGSPSEFIKVKKPGSRVDYYPEEGTNPELPKFTD